MSLAWILDVPPGAKADPSIDTMDPETREMVEMAKAGCYHELARTASDAIAKTFAATFRDATDEAYAEILPDAETRRRYRAVLHTFREHIAPDGVEALP